MAPVNTVPETLAETPVENQPTPLQTPLATQAELVQARTSHLDGFNPPTAEEVTADQAAEEVTLPEGFKLPKTLKATLKLLDYIQAIQPANAAEGRMKAAALRAITIHLHNIQQAPATPTISPADHAGLAASQSAHATALRLEQLARENPEVRQVLNERNALEESNAMLVKQKAELTEKLSKLTKTP